MSRLDDVDRAWLRERHVMLPLAGPDRYCTACARSWPCPTVQALDENDRLRAALEAARIPHLHIDCDPWFSCPLADEMKDSGCLQCDRLGRCRCGCRCQADEHNARIDAALGLGEGSA